VRRIENGSGGRNRCVYPVFQSSHSGQLSLAIPPRVYRRNKIITGDGYGIARESNSDFCVTVGPVTRIVGTLTEVG